MLDSLRHGEVAFFEKHLRNLQLEGFSHACVLNPDNSFKVGTEGFKINLEELNSIATSPLPAERIIGLCTFQIISLVIA